VTVRGIGFIQNRNDDYTYDMSQQLYYRTISETGTQVGTDKPVDSLQSEYFTWQTPACPPDSRKLTLQLSWDKQNWQTIVPQGKNYTFEYFDAPDVTSISPHFGPVKSPNNETIEVIGKNFVCPKNDCSQVTVRFGRDEGFIYMPGTVVDD
jgi:hypothetical protein